MQEKFTSNIKKTSESRVTFTHATLPPDMNEGQTVYGAKLLEWADNLSAVVAIKHRRGAVTTASFDSFSFFKPIELGDFIYAQAYISGVGPKSMEIFIKFIGEKSVSGQRYLAATGFITYAARKLKDGEKVPLIEGETEEEKMIIAGYSKRKRLVKEKLVENKSLNEKLNLYNI